MEGLKSSLVSIYPDKHVVEEGFPLYLCKNKHRFVQYFPEEQVIERTNDFRPTPRKKPKLITPNVFKIFNAAPEFADISRQEMKSILCDDMAISRKFEGLDPLKGNSLAVTDYLDAFELYIISAGPSLSNLVLLVSEKKTFDTMDFPVQLSLDSISVKEANDLKYPIRQISISPLSTPRHIIFAVRTTSTIHLFTYNHEGSLRRLHDLNLAEKTMVDPRIDYSMPVHVETSPYNKYEYAYTTTNGYTSVVDTAQDRVIFADVDLTPEDISYTSQWRSCSFGKSPISLLLASPACIKEWNYNATDSIVLMDRERPGSPVLTWLHGMSDGFPSTLFLEKLLDHKWRITAFSNETQRACMMEFRYINKPLQSLSPTVKVLGLHQMPLSLYHFDDLYDPYGKIRSMGIVVKTQAAENENTTNGYVMFSITRLFEDGSVKTQCLALTPTKPETIDNGRFLRKPRFAIDASLPQFDKLLEDAKLAMLPAKDGFTNGETELRSVKMDHFESYLENDIKCGLAALTDEFKGEIASRMRQSKVPISFRALFKEDEYQGYDLDDLIYFLDQMEVHEDIECIRQVSIPGLSHNYNSTYQDLNRKLKEAYEKRIQLSKIIIRPLPHEDDIHEFQYLGRQDIKFTSTTTTKVLSSLWTIDNTRFDTLTFKQYDTSNPLEPEEFPSVNIHKRRRSSTTIPLPEISIDFDPQEGLDTTASMPVIVKATMPKTKKANAATTSTQQSASTQLLGTTQSQSQNSSLAARSLTNTFSNISTQPVEGAFGSRKKLVQKKKKAKSSGFK
ncbi:hypothetical protein [Parasitella parasitica]|uniref:RNA polymerase I-specific transcription initiation factor RRN6-like protein n=1 Tax=Parasitella parasitica TaxID=35722 RepID=A0A0B7NI85_9FUNG|nr:hypothetical protein [Parasitella parasitica]